MGILKDTYKDLVDSGVSMEDARGVLPIATLTKVGVKYNFKTLVHTGHVRLCYQSQGHWMKIFKMIKKEINDKISPALASFLQPICEVSGRCEYKGIFDRVCPKEARLISKTCEGCILSNMCEFTNEDVKESACAALKKFHRLDW
jgi:thymidylate synthase ThyX